ncbi:RNA polymerase sigma factor [Anaerovorax odorimutans]|uniref:RNA polymerase sigma factor n=1 Tax=Anaerovorax odorimutans TaxID=109327 RepID=UPI000421F1E9|nr:sigma-70 family RNA polymerase sigma factor [Anaerovorax odorimutans]
MFILTISIEDAEKIDVLFRKFERPLGRYILKIVRDEILFEDVLQSTFYKVVKNIEKIGDINSKETKNYLYTIAYTTAIDSYNEKKLQESVTKPYDDTVINIIDEFHADEILAELSMSEEILACIEQLSEKDQDIIALKYGADWDNTKLAEHFNISEESVRKRISRAKIRLAVIIDKRKGGLSDER